MHKTIKLGNHSTNSAKKFWLSDSSAYSTQYPALFCLSSKYKLPNKKFFQNFEFFFFAMKKTLRIYFLNFAAGLDSYQ